MSANADSHMKPAMVHLHMEFGATPIATTWVSRGSRAPKDPRMEGGAGAGNRTRTWGLSAQTAYKAACSTTSCTGPQRGIAGRAYRFSELSRAQHEEIIGHLTPAIKLQSERS